MIARDKILYCSAVVALIAAMAWIGISVSFWWIEENQRIEGYYLYRIEVTSNTTAQYIVFAPFPQDRHNRTECDVVKKLSLTGGDAEWKIVDTEHGKALRIEAQSSNVSIEGRLSKGAAMQLTMSEDEYIRRGDPGVYKHWVKLMNITSNSSVGIHVTSYNEGISTSTWVKINATIYEGWQQVDARYTIIAE